MGAASNHLGDSVACRHRFECIHSPEFRPEGGGDDLQAWEEGVLIHVGAEASVSSGLFLGLPAVRKVRRPRAYRNPKLDRRLTKHRMTIEARLLARLSDHDLPIPNLLAFEESSGVLIQTLMPGQQLANRLRAGGEAEDILTKSGEMIRKLHSLGAVHGDLTTSNILWDGDSGVSLIDFGLSMWTTEVERMGLDLQVLSECLSASHPEYEKALDWVFAGYSNAEDLDYGGSDSPPPDASEVLKRYDVIRSRVRYHS